MWLDVVHAVRSLRKSPSFALVVVGTLALGLGAAVAVFSAIDAVLLAPLPYPEPDRIVCLHEVKSPSDLSDVENVAPGNFLDWRDQSRSFAAIAGFAGFHYILTGHGAPQHLWGGAVSAGWWQVFGVAPEVGRVFTSADDRPNAAQVAVLTDRLWRRDFHADRSIVGRSIRLNGDFYTVLGVMPPNTTSFHREIDFWTPLQRQILPERMLWRDSRFLQTFARLRPGATVNAATAELNRIAARIQRDHASADVFGGASITPLREALTGDAGHELLLVFAIVALVLLVACANVANLMLARITGRAREFAIRTALGAPASRLIRQLLAESVTLALLSAALGLGFAAALLALLRSSAQYHMPQILFAHIHTSEIVFAAVLAIALAVVLAIVPAVIVLRSNTENVLRKAGVTLTSDSGHHRFRNAMAIGEIACSLVLLAGAGLLLRSLDALEHVPLGFRTDHRWVAYVALPRMKYQQDRDVIHFYDRVAGSVRALPGVSDAAIIHPPPLAENAFSTGFTIPGVTAADYQPVALRLTDSHYLPVAGIPIVRGRPFSDADTSNSAPVCLINQAMARRYWRASDPIGHYLILTRGDVSGAQRPRRIVGVIGDVRDELSLEPQPTVYVPYVQMPFPSMYVMIDSASSMASLQVGVERAVQSADPDEPVRFMAPLSDFVADALEPWRFAIQLLGALAGLALLLTAVGVFAVVSYGVRARLREFGIRAALGATPRHILSGVLMQTARIVAFGIAFGTAMAAALTRLLKGLLFGTAAIDPLTFAAVAVLMAATALLASYIPARRASRVDPTVTLRQD